MVKCIRDFSFFTVFLKTRNIISKIKISKVTDYAALTIVGIFKIFLSSLKSMLSSVEHDKSYITSGPGLKDINNSCSTQLNIQLLNMGMAEVMTTFINVNL